MMECDHDWLCTRAGEPYQCRRCEVSFADWFFVTARSPRGRGAVQALNATVDSGVKSIGQVVAVADDGTITVDFETVSDAAERILRDA